MELINRNQWTTVAEDPLAGDSALHANHDGPVVVRWTIASDLDGPLRISVEAQPSYEHWQGVADLRLAVIQSGRRTESAFEIRAGAPTPAGIEFESDGSGFTFEIRLSLPDNEHFSGSQVRIGPARVSQVLVTGGGPQARVATNPVAAGSLLDAAPNEVLTVRWALGQPPVGHVLLTLSADMMDGPPGASANLTLAVVQAGRRTARTVQVAAGKPTTIGFGFFSDGSPARLVCTFGSADTKPSPIRIAPLRMKVGVYDISAPATFYEIAGMKAARGGNERWIVNSNQGGLMNRLVGALSCMWTAERLGASAGLWWSPNQHCAAELHHVFDLERSNIKAVSDDFVAEDYQTYVSYGEVAEPFPDWTARSLIVGTVTTIAGPDGLRPSYAEIGKIFRRFRLAPAIERKLGRYRTMDMSRVVALHIRRPYPSGVFGAQEEAKFRLGADVFVELVEHLRNRHPQVERVLVCANDFETEKIMINRFPGYVFVNEKESIDNTADFVAVQDALVDQTLMARCPILFSQSTTSFGRFANAVGRNDMFSIREGSSTARYLFWHFRDGDPTGELVCEDGHMEALEERIREIMANCPASDRPVAIPPERSPAQGR